MAKNVRKVIVEARYSCSVQKTARKNTKYSRNETILKIGHFAKAIDFPKRSVWVKNSNGQNRAKNDSASTLELFCAKNRCKKHQIFEKWDHFENRPSWKGYRFCKNDQFESKTQMAKNVRKAILQARYSCSVQKTARENTKYSRKENILKIGHLAIDCAKWSVWVQNSKGQKRAKTDSTSTLEFLCAKKPLQKTPNIWKMRPFGKSAILERL